MQRTHPAGQAKLPLLLLVGATALMAAARLCESQSDPLVYLRIVCSCIALGVVMAGRCSLLRSALLAFALEATGGIFTFVYVDVPFINAHHAQIGALAVALHDRIENARQPVTLGSKRSLHSRSNALPTRG